MSTVPILNSAPKIFKSYPFGNRTVGIVKYLASKIIASYVVGIGSYVFGNR